MRTIILHAMAYGLTYILLAALFVGCMGLLNKLLHKPFLDRWKDRLFWFTLSIAEGLLVDLIPRNLLFVVGVPAGFLLLAVVVWVFAKYPSREQRHDARGDESLSLNVHPLDEASSKQTPTTPSEGR